MKHLFAFSLIVFVVACNSCVPTPPPAPQPAPVPTVVIDAGPGPIPNIDPGVRDACANIAKIGCVEGGSSCPGVMQKALKEHLTVVPLDCLVAAHSKDDVHLCGPFVACP